MSEQSPWERAEDYAEYAKSVALSGKVVALTEFILPGSRNDAQQPAWWFLTPEICQAVRTAVDSVQAPVDAPEPPSEPQEPEEPTMPNMEDLHRVRWESYRIEYNPNSGIANFWRAHPELGGALTNEYPLDDAPDGATVGQAFAGNVVVWDADKGARLAV